MTKENLVLKSCAKEQEGLSKRFSELKIDYDNLLSKSKVDKETLSQNN